MFGLDDRIAELAQGGGLAATLFVALLLGLRHASDPDHLAAVSTLIASDPEDGTRRAGRLGPGRVYRLWSAAADTHRREHEIPEIRRVDLAGAALELHV